MTVLDSSWMDIGADNYVDMLAARWQKAAHVYLDHKHNIELARYEDFLDHKAGAISKLATRLGLSEKNDISNDIDTCFQPRENNRNVSWIDFFGEYNLHQIEERCSEEMERLGYRAF